MDCVYNIKIVLYLLASSVLMLHTSAYMHARVRACKARVCAYVRARREAAFVQDTRPIYVRYKNIGGTQSSQGYTV